MEGTPDRYARREFDFGSIVVAYTRATDKTIVTYWGNDGIFEKLIFKGKNATTAKAGLYRKCPKRSQEGEVNMIETAPLANIDKRKTEVLEVMAAAAESRAN